MVVRVVSDEPLEPGLLHVIVVATPLRLTDGDHVCGAHIYTLARIWSGGRAWLGACVGVCALWDAAAAPSALGGPSVRPSFRGMRPPASLTGNTYGAPIGTALLHIQEGQRPSRAPAVLEVDSHCNSSGAPDPCCPLLLCWRRLCAYCMQNQGARPLGACLAADSKKRARQMRDLSAYAWVQRKEGLKQVAGTREEGAVSGGAAGEEEDEEEDEDADDEDFEVDVSDGEDDDRHVVDGGAFGVRRPSGAGAGSSGAGASGSGGVGPAAGGSAAAPPPRKRLRSAAVQEAEVLELPEGGMEEELLSEGGTDDDSEGGDSGVSSGDDA